MMSFVAHPTPRSRDRLFNQCFLDMNRVGEQAGPRSIRPLPLRTAEAASADLGWPLHVIDDCRDDPAVEQPEAFLAALHVALAESA